MISINKIIPLAAALLVLVSSCTKSNYQDGGTLDPVYKGTSYDYLVSRPDMFDSLLKVVRLAQLDQALQTEKVTFFAPPSQSIQRSISFLNEELRSFGRDTVRNLAQLKPAFWKKYLGRYLFKHEKTLVDYPQVDFTNIPVFPGQPYVSYGGDIMNIGVVYGDAGGVQYAGQRTLWLSFIQSLSSPTTSWLNAPVATSNIKTSNGYVHVMRYASPITIDVSGVVDLTNHYFGFNPFLFFNDALEYGIDQ